MQERYYCFNKVVQSVMILGITLSQIGCAQPRYQNEETAAILGGALGAVAGGYVGSQFGGGLGKTLYTAAGATAGAFIGAAAGPELFGKDLALHHNASLKAVSEGLDGSHYWKNPDSGNTGIVRTLGIYKGANGDFCRRYRATVSLKGSISSGEGSACRNDEGQWNIVADHFS